jgi:cytochrome c oxidase assembly protein subunit 15
MADTTIARRAPPADASRLIANWLLLCAALVALMVVVGGATRLTDSGLSIVEWRPVTGAIPPLSQDDWLAAFAKYQTIPEYDLVNRGMSLAEFKEIYWWEWGHRFLGRLIGAAFLIPFLYFLLRQMISPALGLKLAGLFVLGGLQGALGWWMVTSGLSDRIDVSQYRLAAHLALALVLFAALLLLGLDLRRLQREATQRARTDINGRTPSKAGVGTRALRWSAVALAAAVFVQMILGAFVAGLKAGRVYTTWPLMEGRFLPEAYFGAGPRLADLFESPAAAQFNHRIGAYIVAIGAILFYFAARKTDAGRVALVVLIAVFAQAALGVWTLVSATPPALGLLHQAGALVVFASALHAVHYCGAGTAKSLAAGSAPHAEGAGSPGDSSKLAH